MQPHRHNLDCRLHCSEWRGERSVPACHQRAVLLLLLLLQYKTPLLTVLSPPSPSLHLTSISPSPLLLNPKRGVEASCTVLLQMCLMMFTDHYTNISPQPVLESNSVFVSSSSEVDVGEKFTRGQTMTSIFDPKNSPKRGSVFFSTPPHVHLHTHIHTQLHCKTHIILCGYTPASMWSTLTLQTPTTYVF